MEHEMLLNLKYISNIIIYIKMFKIHIYVIKINNYQKKKVFLLYTFWYLHHYHHHILVFHCKH